MFYLLLCPQWIFFLSIGRWMAASFTTPIVFCFMVILSFVRLCERCRWEPFALITITPRSRAPPRSPPRPDPPARPSSWEETTRRSSPPQHQHRPDSHLRSSLWWTLRTTWWDLGEAQPPLEKEKWNKEKKKIGWCEQERTTSIRVPS